MLTDPRTFNYIMLILHTLAAGRWLYEGNYTQAWYWASAASITASVTFGSKP